MFISVSEKRERPEKPKIIKLLNNDKESTGSSTRNNNITTIEIKDEPPISIPQPISMVSTLERQSSSRSLKDTKKDERSRDRERDRERERSHADELESISIRSSKREKRKEERREERYRGTDSPVVEYEDNHHEYEQNRHERERGAVISSTINSRDRDLSSVSNESNGEIIHRRSLEIIEYEKGELQHKYNSHIIIVKL